ncbi:probable tubulin polyglutamylase ttll-15 [Branchiostoma lanceolatum]|uniref:probable tubulin polyglutamylase ttll-15 n=1 Tax=Branchiostoma lanceolatum TaxID=7740 RepID=UPI003455BCAC
MISSYGWEKKNDMPSIAFYRSPGTALARMLGRRMINVVAVVLFFGVFITVLNVYELRGMQDVHKGLQRESSLEEGKRENGIRNEPIDVVREKRDDEVEDADHNRTPRGNGVSNNEIEMADKGVVPGLKDSSQQTKEDKIVNLPDALDTMRQEKLESQHSESDGDRAEKQKDASQQEVVRKNEDPHGPRPSSLKKALGINEKQSRKPSPLNRRRANLLTNKRPSEKHIKHHDGDVKERVIVQSPTVQSDLRHPPSEHVGILNKPAQRLQADADKASVGVAGLEGSKIQRFLPQFARRTLQMHEVQRPQVQMQQVQLQPVKIQQVQMMGQEVQMPQAQGQQQVFANSERSPVVWVHGTNIESGYLDHVLAVFKRTGYKRGGPESDWDVIWSHEYPFMDPKLISHLGTMKPHQKINHWPGGGFVTNKMSLATSEIHFVPQAFRLPNEREDLLRHAGANPKKMWVQKNNNHRGIKIRPLDQLTLTGQSFVQEYVENPFLIDGRKFDIGIYTVVTSINPLRMYMYEEEALFRYCSKAYHPFDPFDVDKYVVDEDYTPTWEMPSLMDTYNRLQYSHKDTWNHYVRSIGKDPSGVWRDIKTSLREVYLSKEHLFIEQLQKYKSSRNFFEMVRFDFVVDEDLNIFLMEVNMSPNMASGHTPPNKFMYEQVLFNLLNLVGVARSIPTTLEGSPDDQNNMMVSDRDIQIYPYICISDTCRTAASCANMYCKLCEHCLTPDWRENLKAAFLEHVGRRNFRRVCPVPMTQEDANNLKPPHDSPLSETNWLMDLWFRGKCHKDPAWCT